jgi:hypothetical protein
MLRRFPLIVIVTLLLAQVSLAEDAYYNVPLSKANLKAQVPEWRGQWRAARDMQSYVRMDGAGEAYYRTVIENPFQPGRVPPDELLHIRAESGKDIAGRLFVPNADFTAMVGIAFTIPASAADPSGKDTFLKSKVTYYQDLLDRNLPGAAWFRFQRDQAVEALGQKAPADRNPMRPQHSELEETFGLFSGDRAMSENLQLDRALRISPGAEATVKLDTIKGIDVREMDWKPLVKDLTPRLDPLASIIPADQHAIFFPTFAAAAAMADEADRAGTPVLNLLELRSEDSRVKERYQQQLGLSLTGLGRLLGPQLINSVAITGSDPYLRLGSDVAVIFEPKDIAALRTMLAGQVALATRGRNDAQAVKGDGPLFSYSGAVTPDHAISSYTAQIGTTLVVSNSLKQLERLANVQKGNDPALAAQSEYIFFRDRYKLGDRDETAFLIVTDATIRRWCGPRWRIADSRRTRALAAMSAEQARNLDNLVKATVTPAQFQSKALDVGPLQLSKDGVSSAVYGNMQFMTPIIELNLDTVTKDEATAYEQWRDNYQRNWRTYFDPIAIRFTANPQTLAADVTIMPLIAGTEYAEAIDLSRGAKISDTASDRHNALAQFVIALNKQSHLMQQIGNFGNVLGMDVKIDILGWIGQTASLYFDDDPYWQELAKVKDLENSFDKHIANLPVALRVEIISPLKFTLFMAAMRGFVEGAAPGMTTWETLKYNDQPYVRITPTEKARKDSSMPQDLAVYYAAMPDALVLSFNENVIKHALDRAAARDKGQSTLAKAHTWLGSNYCVQADSKIVGLLGAFTSRSYQQEMQSRAWGNLPILNEWKKLYPDRDPVKLHESFWQTRLTCPAGGAYVWNEQLQTMESTIYGNPAAPKPGPATPPILNDLLFGNFGIDFENSGLRARAIIDRQPGK